MKKIKCKSSWVFDTTSVLFPDGKTKVVACFKDKSLRIFDLETSKCEKIIKHSTIIFSVHFYKEEQVLMTTDDNGDLLLWDIFSSEKKIIKTVKISNISRTESSLHELGKLTQFSSKLFFCGVRICHFSLEGTLYSINFKTINDIDVEKIDYPLVASHRREELECIYIPKSEKNTVLFGGFGYIYKDFAIKKYNFKTKKHSRFPKKHSDAVLCLTSYFNEKNEEIILSGAMDNKLMFWSLVSSEYLKEIEFKSWICCLLNDYRRKCIFVATGGHVESELYSLDLRRRKVITNIRKIHTSFIHSMKWINENMNTFVSCSPDETFNIFELKKLPNIYEKKDLKERISFIRDEEEFVQKYFSTENDKKMFFLLKF